jgi:hypothetical protein
VDRSLILAHRGLCAPGPAPNSLQAVRTARYQGFGIEVDLRDKDAALVLAHDPPLADEGVASMDDVFAEWTRASAPTDAGLVAINIKSDGLGDRLLELTYRYPSVNFYCFDMSFPQQRAMRRIGLPVATRVSEYEAASNVLVQARQEQMRVWMDCFETDWFIGDRAAEELVQVAKVSIVSPEIHGRDPHNAWDWIARMSTNSLELSVCTDWPEDLWKWTQ